MSLSLSVTHQKWVGTKPHIFDPKLPKIVGISIFRSGKSPISKESKFSETVREDDNIYGKGLMILI